MAVNLKKGEKVSLKKTSDLPLNHVFMGLGWDACKHGFMDRLFKRNKEIDLDASCLMLTEDGKLADIVFYNRLVSQNREVYHSGDNRTGQGDGDDEVIHVHLDRIPAQISYLIFTVTSYEGQTFNNIENAYCRLVDANNNKELVNFRISGGGDHKALLMAILYRKDDEWKFSAIGTPSNFTNPVQMAPACMLELYLLLESGALS